MLYQPHLIRDIAAVRGIVIVRRGSVGRDRLRRDVSWRDVDVIGIGIVNGVAEVLFEKLLKT